MNMEWIQKTETFLKESFNASPYLREHPEEHAYRLEHTYRVANIGKYIAENEGFEVTDLVIACLLHDISYIYPMPTWNERKEHGRKSAQIARPFLESLGIPQERMNDILYGIAIHVDDLSDFTWQRTPFAESVGDADNLDRFDAYRIYETLESKHFSALPLAEKNEVVASSLTRLKELRELHLATPTAVTLWQERIDYYAAFYKKLRHQLDTSEALI